MDNYLGNNNSFNSFATAWQDGLVSESEEDDYHDDNEFDEEEEGDDELGDTVAKELPSPVWLYAIKHNRGKKAPPPPSPRPCPETTKQQRFTTPSQKVKARVTPTVPTSWNSSIITSNQSNVTQASTKKVYQIGGIDIVCENKATNTSDVAVAAFKKADCDTISVYNKNSLITLISSNQQIKFKNLSINITN